MRQDYLLLGLVFYPMLGALAAYAAGRRSEAIRDAVVLWITGSEFLVCLLLLCLSGSAYMKPLTANSFGMFCRLEQFAGLGIGFTLDGFRLVYITVVSFMWLVSSVVSLEYFKHGHNRNRFYLFLLLTYGAVMGVFLAEDLYTVFLFFEMLSFTSYAWVAHEEKEEALRAAGTYLGIAVIGGMVMLMGLFLYVDAMGTANFQMLNHPFISMDRGSVPAANEKQIWIAGLCFLVGFGAKAGAFPLHVWLPKAHPVAPAPASALLSGVLTKCGIFGILILTCYLFTGMSAWGVLLLLIGTVTMLGGAVLALCSVDLKRTLACSSMSQIGFILIGVGMIALLGEENRLAVRGTVLYMVNHSLFKLVLFLAAGVVAMNTHKLNLNDICGFGRRKPLLHFIFLMGALGISGVPLWSGYVGKTLLHESIVEYMQHIQLSGGTAIPGYTDMQALEWLFLVSGGITFAYMLKLYVCLFIQKNQDKDVQAAYDDMAGRYMNGKTADALTVSALLLPVMGIMPQLTMDKLADLGQGFCNPLLEMQEKQLPVRYFTAGNLKGAAISLCIGAVVYLVAVRILMYRKRRYCNLWPSIVDLEDLVYRPVLLGILPILLGCVCRVLDRLVDYIIVMLRKSIFRDSPIPHELGEGTVVTHAAGLLLDDGIALLNKTICKNKPIQISWEHKLASIREMLEENNVIITRSLSFGLMIFVMGLVGTLIYMLAG